MHQVPTNEHGYSLDHHIYKVSSGYQGCLFDTLRHQNINVNYIPPQPQLYYARPLKPPVIPLERTISKTQRHDADDDVIEISPSTSKSVTSKSQWCK